MKHKHYVIFLAISILSLTSCSLFHQHDNREQVIVKAPTCTEDGVGYFKCSKDDARSEEVVIPAYGHNYVSKHYDPTCSNEGYDLTYCSHCGDVKEKTNIVPALGHDFEHTHIEATCLQEGIDESHCSRCGISEYEAIKHESLGHKYVFKSHVEVSCLGAGYDIYECERCKKEHYDNIVPALGHDMVEEDTNPTCVEKGRHLRHCSRCDYVAYDDEIEAHGHHYIAHTTPSSCLESGYTTYICSICGNSYVGDYTPALGHELVHHEEKEATCLESGYHEYDECIRCGYSTKVDIPPIREEGHEFTTTIISPTTSSRGYTLHTCTHCDYSYKDNYVDATPAFASLDVTNAISGGYHQGNIINSCRDDDRYYYYIYIGHAINYPIHERVAFNYDIGTESMNSFPETTTAIAMDLEQTLKKAKEEAASGIADKLIDILSSETELQAGAKPQRILNHSFDQYARKLAIAANYYTPIETNGSNAYISLAQKVNNVSSSYNKDGTGLEIGYRYTYSVSMDIGFYVGCQYDLKNKTISYDLYTELSNKLQETITMSEGLYNVSMDPLSPLESVKLTKPTTYETNHPLITKPWNGFSTKTEVGRGSEISDWLKFDCKDTNIENYYNSGYDSVRITFSFDLDYSYWVNDGFRVWISTNASNTEGICVMEFDKKDGGKKTYDEYWQLSLFAPNNGITIMFQNRSSLTGVYYVQNLNVTMRFYNQNAYNNNAYNGQV